MNIQEAYTKWAASYDRDRNLTRDLDRRVTRTVLAELACDAILEIGCGTGKNTPLLAGIARTVLALDFSTGMLGRARAKVAADHVTFAVADATMPWPCAAQSVDLVTCNLVLEHVPDLGGIFAQAARVLAPGGRIFVCELHPFRQYVGKKATFQRGQETVEIPAFVHHLSEYLQTAVAHNFFLLRCNEWWHDDDVDEPPRLASFLFRKYT